MCCCWKHKAGLISGSEMPGGPSLLGPLIYYVSGGQAPGGQLAEHRAGELVASSCAHSCHHTSGQGSAKVPSLVGPACRCIPVMLRLSPFVREVHGNIGLCFQADLS